jgi:RHS repeat-associated protein
MTIEPDGETETKYYYHLDGLGSVAAVSNTSTHIVERYSCKVFSEPAIRDANDEIRYMNQYGKPYPFTGRRYDGETGLYYYRARYYAYDIGRSPFSANPSVRKTANLTTVMPCRKMCGGTWYCFSNSNHPSRAGRCNLCID